MQRSFFDSTQRSLEGRFADAQENLSSLKRQKDNYPSQLQQKRQEIVDVEFTNDELSRERITVVGDLSDAQSIAQQKKIELSDLSFQMNNLSSSINDLYEQINILEGYINARPPKARYRTDGEYCINGIHNCTNHPPRQVLDNKFEIDDFNDKVRQYEATKESLVSQRNDIMERYTQVQSDYYQVQSDLEAAQDNEQSYESRLKEIDDSIESNNQLLGKKNQEYCDLIQQSVEIDSQVWQAQSTVTSLSQRLQYAPQSRDNISSEQPASFSSSDIRALAMQELQQEALATTDDIALSASPDITSLAELALRELAEEAQAVDMIARRDISGIGQGFQSARSAVEGVVNTAVSLLNPASLLVQTMFDGPEMRQLRREQGEEVPESTGNLIIDYANGHYSR